VQPVPAHVGHAETDHLRCATGAGRHGGRKVGDPALYFRTGEDMDALAGPAAPLQKAAAERRAAMLSAARELARTLARRGAERVVLFGSLADPAAWIGPNSDVDLAVVMPDQAAVPFHRRLADDPAVQAFPYPLDLLVYTPEEWRRLLQERTFLRQEVAARGMVLHE
jgi:predicted nucleotidyltransferase